MEIFSDILKSAKGAVGSALEKSQATVIQATFGNLLPRAIENVFEEMDQNHQKQFAAALKEIVEAFTGDNARELDWGKLMKDPGTQALLNGVVKQMAKALLGLNSAKNEGVNVPKP